MALKGHRLGSADEAIASKPIERDPISAKDAKKFEDPTPSHNPDLSEEDRQRIREDRAKAAEARLQNTQTKKKKKTRNQPPLHGPNSQYTMKWTSG